MMGHQGSSLELAHHKRAKVSARDQSTSTSRHAAWSTRGQTTVGGRRVGRKKRAHSFRAQNRQLRNNVVSSLLKQEEATQRCTMTPEPSAVEKDTTYCISYNDVLKASERIQGVAHKTPVLTSASFDSNGRRLFFKTEAMQRTGSFKFRGALNAIKTEVANTSSPSLTVVTHSSGNHAAAVALAATLSSTKTTQVSATIVMPNNAPIIKKAGVEGFGGNIVSVENTPEAREEAADEIMSKSGGVFVHPSEDPRVIAGQGTVSVELVAQVKEMGHTVDAVIIPVGGGGLASGNTIALRGMLGDKVKVRCYECLRILAREGILDSNS